MSSKKVPKLRFPEFRDKGEWKAVNLGQCLIKHPEYGINAPAVPYSDDLPTYLRITDISEDGCFLSEQKVSVAKDVTDDNYLSEGDIVLARTGASVGKAYKYRSKDGKLVFAGFLIRVRPDVTKLNSELLFQFLFTGQYWRWIALTSARSGQPGINGNEYASLPIPLPSTLGEQQKIADCLSSLDDLITVQTQKIDATKSHKKGLMQQLFPAEGETVPKLRFPEFRDKGEWEYKTLEPYLELYSARISADGSVLPIYSSTREGLKLQKEYYNGRELVNEGEYGVVPNGHFVYRHMSDDITFKFNINDTGSLIAVSKEYPIFKTLNLNSRFLLYVLNEGTDFKRFAETQRKGGTRTRLYFKTLCIFKTLLPPPPEQQKIADCLTSLDDLITVQTQKLDALKAHKKGLMQQLFPSIDNEVHG